MIHFNSIKVRLELTDQIIEIGRFNKFQFHKGAIRTVEKYREHVDKLDFNSIKVRLELSPTASRRSGFLISIP